MPLVLMGDVDPDRNTVVLVLGAGDDSGRPATKQPSAGLAISTRASSQSSRITAAGAKL
jgi:hypothetical protein